MGKFYRLPLALYYGKQVKVFLVNFVPHITELRFREDKLNQLCSVMGVNWLYDPDRAYELTTDNVKKILAIHMRFR